MQMDEYQAGVQRTMPLGGQSDQLTNFALGLAGESGEVVDQLKKYLYHKHPLDPQEIQNELGDVLWYLTALAATLGITLADLALTNLKKLEQRYPKGFNYEDSLNRREFVNEEVLP